METCNCIGKLYKLPSNDYYETYKDYECNCEDVYVQINTSNNYINYIRSNKNDLDICLDPKCLLGCKVTLNITFEFINDISYIRDCLNKVYENILFL